MRDFLNRKGHKVNRKRVQRLMRVMGLESIAPKKRMSIGEKGHKIYPYLLRGLEISYPNQLWCSDLSVLQEAAWEMRV